MMNLPKWLFSLLAAVFFSLVMRVSADEPRASFDHLTVDAQPPDRPYYKMVGDLDGDGDLDIVVGGAQGPLVWYANPGWQKTRLADGGWDGVHGRIADLDGDGDADIVMGGVVWFANPRIGGGSWRQVRVDKQRTHDVEVADLNGDGKLDLIARDQSAFGKSGNVVYVYLQQNPQSFRKYEIPCPHGEGLAVADLDGDQDQDIVIGGRWFENSSPVHSPDKWPEHNFTSGWKEPDTQVAVGDINGDGRPDVVLTPAELRGETYKVAWFEAPDDPSQEGWKEHVVVPQIECVIHSLGLGDFDQDGQLDIAIAEMHQGADPDEVSVFWNAGQGRSWRQHVLSKTGSHDLVVADLDGDGDLDILGANHAGTHPLEWWRNRRR